MKKFKTLLAAIIVVAALVLIFSKLFAPQPLEIVLETGQEVTADEAYFSIADALLLTTCSLVAGLLIAYLYYQGELENITKIWKAREQYNVVEPLLKQDERVLLAQIKKGEILQNALVTRTGLSKVKITRILARLERKGLILKERKGLTNSINLKINQ